MKKAKVYNPGFVNPHKPGETIQTPYGTRTVKTILGASVELVEAIPHTHDEGRARHWTTAQEIQGWNNENTTVSGD